MAMFYKQRDVTSRTLRFIQTAERTGEQWHSGL